MMMLHLHRNCTGRCLKFYLVPPFIITIIGSLRCIRALMLTSENLVVLLFTSSMTGDDGRVSVVVSVHFGLAFRYLHGFGLS